MGTIEGNCARLRAKPVTISGHLPAIERITEDMTVLVDPVDPRARAIEMLPGRAF